MSELHLSAGRLRATIFAHVGAGIADFSMQGPSGYYYPIMRRAAPGEMNASLLGSFIMAPWVNRINGAKFTWNGKEYQLRPTTTDNMAQHGDVRKRAWRILEDTQSHAILEFDSESVRGYNWPWRFRCRVEYALTPDAFSMDLSVMNTDKEPFPAACGHHPYFMRRLWSDRDILEVRASVSGRYPLANGCPTGGPVAEDLTRALANMAPVPDTHVDAVLSGFGGRAEMRWAASGVTMRMITSQNMNHLVFFAPHVSRDRSSPISSVAIEPQTAVNDALNLAARGVPGTGSAVLKPGEMLKTTCRLEVSCDGADGVPLAVQSKQNPSTRAIV
ncbi:MAG: hypothetical protein SFY96_14220 [Planctomycetota bacterium]|nr:hypothetical protein [Planctomycetota bacterium]